MWRKEGSYRSWVWDIRLAELNERVKRRQIMEVKDEQLVMKHSLV